MFQKIDINQKIISFQTIDFIKFLEKDNFEIYETLKKESLENPFLEIYDCISGDGEEKILQLESKENFHENLHVQIKFLKVSSKEEQQIRDILSYIDDKGFLPLKEKELAKQTGISLHDLRKRIDYIKLELDPKGLCCWNSIDYIKFQIQEEERFKEREKNILVKNLELFFMEELKVISEKLKICEARIEEIKKIIRTFSMSPIVLENDSNRNIYPEIDVKIETGGKLKISLLKSFQVKLNGGFKGDDSRSFYKAKKLLDFLEKRDQNLLKVSSYILNRQSSYFEEDKLAPLTLKEISEETGLHVSTVSRIIRNRYITSPKGVVKLSFFKTKGFKDLISQEELKLRIKELILKEEKITDLKISEILKEMGISISRRTVSKYRNLIGEKL